MVIANLGVVFPLSPLAIIFQMIIFWLSLLIPTICWGLYRTGPSSPLRFGPVFLSSIPARSPHKHTFRYGDHIFKSSGLSGILNLFPGLNI